MILYAILITYIGITMYLANLDDLHRRAQAAKPATPPKYGLPEIAAQQRETILRWLMYGMMVMNVVYASFILQVALLRGSIETLPQEVNLELPEIHPLAAILNFGLCVILSILAYRVVTSDATRQGVRGRLGANILYDPTSSVHTVATVLVLMLVGYSTGALVQNVEVAEVTLSEVLFQAVLFLAAAFLGVGLAIRRDIVPSLQRLGLRLPTSGDVVWGVGGGFGLLGLWLVAAILSSSQAETTDPILLTFNTLPLAFILSLAAAVSEEILFRGALQPVFGVVITTLIFTLLHVQYALSIGTVIILLVALGLAWLRIRQSTTAAIIAHFVYNFVQLAAAILYMQSASGSV